MVTEEQKAFLVLWLVKQLPITFSEKVTPPNINSYANDESIQINTGYSTTAKKDAAEDEMTQFTRNFIGKANIFLQSAGTYSKYPGFALDISLDRTLVEEILATAAENPDWRPVTMPEDEYGSYGARRTKPLPALSTEAADKIVDWASKRLAKLRAQYELVWVTRSTKNFIRITVDAQRDKSLFRSPNGSFIGQQADLIKLSEVFPEADDVHATTHVNNSIQQYVVDYDENVLFDIMSQEHEHSEVDWRPPVKIPEDDYGY